MDAYILYGLFVFSYLMCDKVVVNKVLNVDLVSMLWENRKLQIL